MSGIEELLEAMVPPNERAKIFFDSEAKDAETFTVEQQIETLKKIEMPQLKVGDIVTTNEFGKSRMRYPNDHRQGMVVEVFSEPKIDEDGEVIHGVVAVAFSEKNVKCFTMDFRYLTPAE